MYPVPKAPAVVVFCIIAYFIFNFTLLEKISISSHAKNWNRFNNFGKAFDCTIFNSILFVQSYTSNNKFKLFTHSSCNFTSTYIIWGALKTLIRI